jgi:hypothetical protein
MIRQILREGLRKRKICTKFVPHQTHGKAEATETHIMPKLHPHVSEQSSLHFLFPEVDTALKGKRFQGAEDRKT